MCARVEYLFVKSGADNRDRGESGIECCLVCDAVYADGES